MELYLSTDKKEVAKPRLFGHDKIQITKLQLIFENEFFFDKINDDAIVDTFKHHHHHHHHQLTFLEWLK